VVGDELVIKESLVLLHCACTSPWQAWLKTQPTGGPSQHLGSQQQAGVAVAVGLEALHVAQLPHHQGSQVPQLLSEKARQGLQSSQAHELPLCLLHFTPPDGML